MEKKTWIEAKSRISYCHSTNDAGGIHKPYIRGWESEWTTLRWTLCFICLVVLLFKSVLTVLKIRALDGYNRNMIDKSVMVIVVNCSFNLKTYKMFITEDDDYPRNRHWTVVAPLQLIIYMYTNKNMCSNIFIISVDKRIISIAYI